MLIVAFAALAGSSGSISEIIGFRAGWGIGNALFIATSLAVIVASASGGFAGAIVLYETALGLGIAVGPLVGGTLGEISWRGPFYGVSVLMAIALIATVVLVEKTPKPAHDDQPRRAVQGAAAPRPAHHGAHRALLQLGLLHDPRLRAVPDGAVADQARAWCSAAGASSSRCSPCSARRGCRRRLGIARTMYANLFVFALISLGIAIWTLNKPVLIVLVIVSGIVCGVNNTVTTQAVMTVSPVERPVASAAYSFVRFIGGGLAPYAAGRLVVDMNIHCPFYLGRRGDPARHRHPVHRPQAARARPSGRRPPPPTAALSGTPEQVAAERELEAEERAEALPATPTDGGRTAAPVPEVVRDRGLNVADGRTPVTGAAR